MKDEPKLVVKDEPKPVVKVEPVKEPEAKADKSDRSHVVL